MDLKARTKTEKLKMPSFPMRENQGLRGRIVEKPNMPKIICAAFFAPGLSLYFICPRALLCFCFGVTKTSDPISCPCPRTPFAFRPSWNHLGLFGATLEPSVIQRFQSVAQLPLFWGSLSGALEAIILGTSFQVFPPRREVHHLLRTFHRATRAIT